MSCQIPTRMLFAERIRQLREEKQLLQRQVSAALEMDNALYCKIERGDRFMKREQVAKLSELFQIDSRELLVLWLADKINEIIIDEEEIAIEALKIAQNNVTT